jgi:hypothetical protein
MARSWVQLRQKTAIHQDLGSLFEPEINSVNPLIPSTKDLLSSYSATTRVSAARAICTPPESNFSIRSIFRYADSSLFLGLPA